MSSSSNSRPAVRRCCLYQTSLHGCKMTYIGLMQAPLFQASGGRAVSQQRFTKMQTWVTVMTGIGPSFRVGVSFWAISLCLFLKLPLNGLVYILTVGRVLNTNVFQLNLGELLFRATLKVRLGSCLSTALKMDNLDCTKINAHFKTFTACLQEGLIHDC